MTAESLRMSAEYAEREKQPVSAMLLRNQAWLVEHGKEWKDRKRFVLEKEDSNGR